MELISSTESTLKPKWFLGYEAEFTKKKRFLQERLIECIGILFRSNILALVGPNVPIYLQKFRRFLTAADAKITSYEIDAFTYTLQKTQVSYLPKKEQKRVELHYGNIIAAKPERFIDLDFLQTWKKSEHIISSLFKKQFTLKVKAGEKRVFNVTTTRRGESNGPDWDMKALMLYVNDLLGTELSIFDEVVIKDCSGEANITEHLLTGKSSTQGTDYVVRVYSYKDRGNMANVLIQY